MIRIASAPQLSALDALIHLTLPFNATITSIMPDANSVATIISPVSIVELFSLKTITPSLFPAGIRRF